MTYDAQETSAEAGQPVELYEFRLDTEIFRFTSHQVAYTIPVQVEFAPENITRGELITGVGAEEQENLTVTLPTANDFISRYVQIAPGKPGQLKILRTHVTDLAQETRTIFEGTIKNVTFSQDGLTANVVLTALMAASARGTPRFTYATQCNHILYDAGCKINFNNVNFLHAGLVTGVSGNVITVTGAAAKNVLTDFFQAGLMSFDGESRTIQIQSGDDLTITAPFATSPLGSVVEVRAGCQQRFQDDCVSKFSNGDNFGGFPYVPQKNPFEGLD